MKNFFTLFILVMLCKAVTAQNDVGVTSITSPVTGCALSAAENVTIRIFNYGVNITTATPFPVSYTINGGAPVTETITANILSNSTYIYTFTTQANLSTPGTYIFDAYTSYPFDINSTNDAFTGYSVISVAPSVAGTISGASQVCITGNSGTLTLGGNTGNVLRWEYSLDKGVTWVNISNTTTTQNYSNLTDTTQYRVLVQNGICPAVNSSGFQIDINPASVGGTVAPAASTVCSGTNGGTLTLSGRRGNVVRWESSPDGVTWTPIANTTTSQTYLNLTSTTRYRAVVQSGVCASANSSVAIVTVSPTTVGGSITPAATTVCSGTNSGTLTLSGHTGAVQRWEFSTNGGGSWTNIANTTTSQPYLNLTTTTTYRALVRSTPCATAYSATADVTVAPGSVGGTLSSSDTVCSGANSGTLTLAGNTGAIVRWEFSVNGGATWTDIANTTNSESYLNLTTNTQYRVLVQNGTCPSVYSSIVTITVNPASNGGTVAGSDTVCASSNSGTLTLSGHVGAVLNWESSEDGGLTWANIANTTSSQAYNNLTATTQYRVQVQSGVCPAAVSDTATIYVDSLTVGGTVSGAGTVCSGANNGTLNLTGETGDVLQWEYSTDNGLTWITIVNTTNSQSYNNLTTATMYRALVKSGLCSSQYSGTATITVNPQSVGGTVYGAATVCSGSNSGTLTLIGSNGSILNWESSTDNGATWSPIANATSSENYLNLTATTIYRSIVQSGVCPQDTSLPATITVDSASVGGTVAGTDTVCAGANSGSLTLSGHTGNVIGWEISTDGGTTWFSISNTTTTQNYNNLNNTTMYRAVVKSGVCNSVTSSSATIMVVPQSTGGSISGSASVCEGVNSGTLTLSGNTGAILYWQSSTDAGSTWDTIVNTTTTHSYLNLNDTTWFRAIVQSGACTRDTSAMAIITIYPKPVAGFSTTDVCIGNPTVFTDSTTISSGFIQFYNWSFGDNESSSSVNPSHTYSNAGTYNVNLVVYSDKGCSDTAMVAVVVNSLPSADITVSGNLQFCFGDSAILNAPVGINYTYLWNTLDTTQTITVDSSSTYSLIVTDTVTGCMNSDSVSIFVYSLPIAFAGADTSVGLGKSITLIGSGGINYAWSPVETLNNPAVAQPLATPTVTTTYVLTVTDINGCSDNDSVTVVVILDYDFIVSNFMTPNGDGFNDTWNIENIENYPDNEITIFNRNGQELFSTTSYKNDWGGTFNGKQLPDGTYYYIIKFTGVDKVIKGGITIHNNK